MLKKLLKNYFSSGLPDTADYVLLRKVLIINSFSLVGISSLFTFGLLYIFYFNNLVIGTLELIYSAIGIWNIFYLRKSKNPNRSGSIILSFMYTILLVFLYDGGIEGSGIFWYYTFPILAFFLTDRKTGRTWILTLLFSSILLYSLQYFQLLPSPPAYSPLKIILFAVSFVAVTILAHSYELLKSFLDNLILENAEAKLAQEKIESQIQIAQDIQKSLLPPADIKFDDIEISSVNFQAHGVGGDYYDYVLIDDNTLAFIILDVAGNGIPAAMVMNTIRSVFRSLMLTPRLTPKGMMAHINKILNRDYGPDIFATVLFFTYDRVSRKITFSNAGHMPLIRANTMREGVEEIQNVALPLGVIEDTSQYNNYIAQLEKGDVFILFTDGITEAMTIERKPYGVRRFYSMLEQNSSKSAREIRDLIYTDLTDFLDGADPDDDISMVVVKIIL
jgi:serine phosphatase RsbU (regulator of sigma subunit)